MSDFLTRKAPSSDNATDAGSHASAPQLGSRDQFPNLRFDAYLAHAAISPACEPVLQAAQACLQAVAEVGVGAFPIYHEQRQRLRTKLGALVHVPAKSIALTGGCTRGITDVALALPWARDDVLLTYVGEFPANVTPWQIAARKNGGIVELQELPSVVDEHFKSKLLENLTGALKQSRSDGGRIRWVAVSAVQFQTGMSMPLAEMAKICASFDVRILVDGIQGCGVVPYHLEEMGIDAFFTGAHKWLLGLEGVGFSYLSPRFMAELSPLTAGWLSHPEGELFLFQGSGHLRHDRPLKKDPQVFEGSTANVVGFAALEAAVDLLETLTPTAIHRHVQSYHDRLEPELQVRGFASLRAKDPELRSCSCSFLPPEGTNICALSVGLREKGVMVSIPDGILRIAPHFSNNIQEIPRVLEAFDSALKSS